MLNLPLNRMEIILDVIHLNLLNVAAEVRIAIAVNQVGLATEKVHLSGELLLQELELVDSLQEARFFEVHIITELMRAGPV